jgi:hypothetical protein
VFSFFCINFRQYGGPTTTTISLLVPSKLSRLEMKPYKKKKEQNMDKKEGEMKDDKKLN